MGYLERLRFSFAIVYVIDCGGKPADVYFVIDASSSIREQNYRKMLRFVSDVVDIFDIGPDKTRIGVVLFSDGIHPIIHLNNDLSKDLLKQRIIDATYLQGGTRTGGALRYIRQRGFSKEYARSSVAHIAIILTDGQSSDIQVTVTEAERARNDGIYLFAIGIGGQIDLLELKAIASKPVNDFMFEIDNYDALASIKNILAIQTCTGKL